ncbi:NifB/NifX family molybdenum-iron cluster-binding protein [Marinobacterium zhoushanense]|nr:nitrogen fixation protein [Marinobacterium zhoushanense]
MKSRLIAIATNEQGLVAPHAGRAKRWHVYALEPNDDQPELVWEINLTETGSLHEWHVRDDGRRHPLHAVDIAIAGSAGDGVTRRLAERGTELVTTAEPAPLKALTDYLNNRLSAGVPHEEPHCLHPEKREERAGL